MNKDQMSEQNLENIDKFYGQMEREKEDRLINLIAEIIVDATLKEYYGQIDAGDNPTSGKKRDE